MIPIKISSSKIKVRNENGEFEEVSIGSSNLGTTVNIDDNAEGSNSTWSSNKLKGEIQTIIQQVQQSSDELDKKIEDSKTWTVNVVSSNGVNCTNDDYITTLSVELYHGNDLVTDQFDSSCFIWVRESLDKDGDIAWNATHNTGSKTLEISAYDTVGYSVTDFICQFWDTNNKIMLAKSN